MSTTLYTIELRVTNSPDATTNVIIKADLKLLAAGCQRRLQQVAPYNRVQVLAYAYDAFDGRQDILCDLGREFLLPFSESAFAKTTG